MKNTFNFSPEDGLVRRIVMPGDYLTDLKTRIAGMVDSATIDNTYVCPDAWAVRAEHPRNYAVERVWKLALSTIVEYPHVFSGTSLMPVRANQKYQSLVFVGNTDVLSPQEIETRRQQMVTQLIPYTQLEGFEL